MYKIELLPIAKEDIDNILHYISLNLKNKTASRNLRKAFMNGIIIQYINQYIHL